MATFSKRGDKWLAEVRIKKKRASKTFITKLEARAWAVEKEREFSRDRKIVEGKTMGDAFRKYAQEISPAHKGERWEVIRLEKLAKQPFADTSLMSLTYEDIEQWISDSCKTLSANSIRREFSMISATLSVAQRDWKWIDHNPAKMVRLPKKTPPRDRRISDIEISRILAALEYHSDGMAETSRQQLAVAFLLAIETAMRMGEIYELEWSRINLEKKYLSLLETKNGTRRDVPLSRKAIALLEQRLSPSEYVFSSNKVAAGVLFRKVLKECHITDLRFHDTRHEGLTRLARKLDVLDLARMVGHKDPRSLMIYYNATASEIAERLG